MEPYQFTPGDAPVLISQPHVGTGLPTAISASLTPEALTLPDTDWHINRLYRWAAPLGISILQASYSRYVIDLNRPPNDTPLYEGATTELVPTTFFDGRPLYRPGGEPDQAAIQQRREDYWRPYHQRLEKELERLRQRHGYAILLDAHSIRSVVPRLFDGQLPDLNLGSNSGQSADAELIQQAATICAESPYSSVLDGRFRGGYITRHYGNPSHNIHALQLELAQLNYMDEDPPFNYQEERATALQRVLRQLIDNLLTWRPTAP